ncbi:MAG: response regulator [Bacteroidia bacterium]
MKDIYKHSKILLVEDDTDDQEFFLEAIKQLSSSLECDIASNGREALNYIVLPPLPSIIFLDINMPVMDGFECLEHLKKSRLHKHIPIIIYTTSISEQDKEKAISMGADGFLSKPALLQVLKNRIDEFLRTDYLMPHLAHL